MQNIPVFTTEYGVASLILESVPARHEAFIHIRSTLQPDKLLRECKGFCIACGAKHIYAAGDESLEQFPFYMSVLQLRGSKAVIGETDCALFPVQEKTAPQWRRIYNEKMAEVPKAAFLTEFAMKKLLQEGNAYFIHRDGVLLGIGVATGNRIDAVAAVIPGMGAEVVRALCHALSEETVMIEAASTNERAMRLYRKMGFLPTAELSRWYKII